MTYQYKREPLSIEEADRLLNAAQTLQEKHDLKPPAIGGIA
jgi:hypothetical protein